MLILCMWVGVRAAEPAVDPALRERCVALLQAGLASGEFWPAMHAAEALTQAGYEAVVLDALKARLEEQTNDQYRCGLSRERVRAGDLAPVDTFASILANKQSNGRIHAAESLYKVRAQIPEFKDDAVVRSALDEGDPVLELMAAAALFRGGDRSVLARVRRHLSSPDPKHWRIAAWVLGRLGDRSDWEGLRQLTQVEADALSRSFVWNALAQLEAPGALDQVKANLGSADNSVRTYAAQTVGDCNAKELLPLLIPLLDDEHLDARLRTAQAILRIAGRSQARDAVPQGQ